MTTANLAAVALAVTLVLAADPRAAVAAGAAREPTAEEQRAFAEGMRRYEAGDGPGAAEAWRQGYAAGRDPAFLVRIGEALEKAGAVKEAAESYQRYLRESPDAADRADIEARIRRLTPAAAGNTTAGGVSGADAAETPGELGAGAADAAAAADGRPPGGPAATASAPAPAQTQAVDPSADLRPIIESDQPARSGLNIAAWSAVGATALLLGAAAFYGASAAEKAGDVNRLLSYSDPAGVPLEYGPMAGRYQDALADGERYDQIAIGLAIAAGATALAAAGLFVADAAVGGGRAPVPATTRRTFSLAWSF